MRREAGARELGRSVVYFPLVGVLLGFILLGLDRLFLLALPLAVVNVLLIIAMVILTGAIHLDGFIDTCDGALERGSPAERLKIMSDSRVGSFGVIGAVSLVLLKYAALAALPEDGAVRAPALVLMPLISRWAMVYAISAYPYARQVGTGKAFKEHASWQRFAISTAVVAVLASLLAGLSGLALIGAVWLTVAAVARFLKGRLGGLSGDTYGAVNELSEVMVLVLLPLLADVLTMHFIGPWNIFQF